MAVGNLKNKNKKMNSPSNGTPGFYQLRGTDRGTGHVAASLFSGTWVLGQTPGRNKLLAMGLPSEVVKILQGA